MQSLKFKITYFYFTILYLSLQQFLEHLKEGLLINI